MIQLLRCTGVDGAFLREIAGDEKLCMFELLLTRLQARRLATAVVALDTARTGTGVDQIKETSVRDTSIVSCDEVSLQQTPSSNQIEAVRNRVRRLHGVLDLSVAQQPRLPSHSQQANEFLDIEVQSEGQQNGEAERPNLTISWRGPGVYTLQAGDHDRQEREVEMTAWDEKRSTQEDDADANGWNVRFADEVNMHAANDEGVGAVAQGKEGARNMSPVSTDSEHSVEGELHSLWQGVGSLGGGANLLPASSPHEPSARAVQRGSHEKDVDRRLLLAGMFCRNNGD